MHPVGPRNDNKIHTYIHAYNFGDQTQPEVEKMLGQILGNCQVWKIGLILEEIYLWGTDFFKNSLSLIRTSEAQIDPRPRHVCPHSNQRAVNM